MISWNTVAVYEWKFGNSKISNSEKLISICKSWGEKWWILEVIISSPMTCDSNILQLVLYQRFYPEKLQFRVNSRSERYANKAIKNTVPGIVFGVSKWPSVNWSEPLEFFAIWIHLLKDSLIEFQSVNDFYHDSYRINDCNTMSHTNLCPV